MVYLAHDPLTGLYKLGASKCPRQRVSGLTTQLGRTVVLLGTRRGNYNSERAWHKRLEHWRVTNEWGAPRSREWYAPPPRAVRALRAMFT